MTFAPESIIPLSLWTTCLTNKIYHLNRDVVANPLHSLDSEELINKVSPSLNQKVIALFMQDEVINKTWLKQIKVVLITSGFFNSWVLKISSQMTLPLLKLWLKLIMMGHSMLRQSPKPTNCQKFLKLLAIVLFMLNLIKICLQPKLLRKRY